MLHNCIIRISGCIYTNAHVHTHTLVERQTARKAPKMVSTSLSEWRGYSWSLFSFAPVFANFPTMTTLCPGSLELLESRAGLERLGGGGQSTAGKTAATRWTLSPVLSMFFFFSLDRQGRRLEEGTENQDPKPLSVATGSLPSQSQWPLLACPFPTAWALVDACKAKRVGSGALWSTPT